MSGEELRHLVAQSRAAQGLPAQVEDPAVIARAAALLGAPANLHARRVEAVEPPLCRVHDHALDDELDEGPSAFKVGALIEVT